MSDDGSGIDGNEGKDGPKNPLSVTRYSTVTDDLDTVFDLLSHARRRYLLYYLFTMNGTVAELEAAVNAVCKYEAAGADADDFTRESVRIGLHHTHLPQLAEAGIIDYDRRHGTIRFAGHPSLEEWVEHAQYRELD